jgi:glycosyltransferase involved in cell wall biosynthesis
MHNTSAPNKLRVLFIAGGFPLPETPTCSVFNKRAADSLSEFVELTVLSFRTWIPGRPLKTATIIDNKYRLITLYIPHNMYGSLKWFKINFTLFYVFTLLFCSKLLKNKDIIHAADFNFYYLASKLKKRFGLKVILQGIGGDINQELPQLMKLNILNNDLTNLDGFTFNSKALETKFVDLFGNLNPRKVIYRGCDLHYFINTKRKDSTTLEFLFLGGFPNYLNFPLGKNTKGGFDLLEAWERIEPQFTNLNVKLSIGGPETSVKELNLWKQRLHHPELIDVIGEINPSNIKKVLAHSNVLIIPSREEGMPNTLMEACAMGLAVIGSNAGGIPEVIENGITGLLFDKGNIDQLSCQIKDLIRNSEKISILGHNARLKMEQKFSSDSFASTYHSFYKKILQ